jgi:hypothetical protein
VNSFLPHSKRASLKLQRRNQMPRHELPIMVTRINLNHVIDVTLIEQFVQLPCARVEPVIILVPAVSVDLEASQTIFAGVHKWRIRLPETFVGWITKGRAKELCESSVTETSRQ